MNAEDVRALRNETGRGLQTCRDALELSDGDVEKAAEMLRHSGGRIYRLLNDKRIQLLHSLLKEIVDNPDNVEVYPGAIENSGPKYFDFEEWAMRARQAIGLADEEGNENDKSEGDN